MSKNTQAIMGIKIGMSQIFDNDGKAIPVTVVEAGPCRVIQKKPGKMMVTRQYRWVLVI